MVIFNYEVKFQLKTNPFTVNIHFATFNNRRGRRVPMGVSDHRYTLPVSDAVAIDILFTIDRLVSNSSEASILLFQFRYIINLSIRYFVSK